MMNEKIKGVKFIRIKNCSNGNPRYIFSIDDFAGNVNFKGFDQDYIIKTAKNIGAKQYKGKGFNDYFVVSTYNLYFFIDFLIESFKK